MDATQLPARLEIAVEAAREAGRLTLEYYGAADLAVHTKADLSPVTEADRCAEQLLRQRLSAAFPDDGFLGEEFGETVGKSGARWILDPIDGTKSFVRAVPLYGTMVGLEWGAEAVLGVVYFPALDEIVYAAKGLGAWWVPANRAGSTPQAARVSSIARLDQSLFCTTSPDYFYQIHKPDLFERVRAAAALHRGWSDCYGHALVATGRTEVMIDPVMNPWDCAALKPILEEAGGTFTDLQGNPTIYGGSGMSTNGHVFDQVMRAMHPRGPQ